MRLRRASTCMAGIYSSGSFSLTVMCAGDVRCEPAGCTCIYCYECAITPALPICCRRSGIHGITFIRLQNPAAPPLAMVVPVRTQCARFDGTARLPSRADRSAPLFASPPALRPSSKPACCPGRGRAPAMPTRSPGAAPCLPRWSCREIIQ